MGGCLSQRTVHGRGLASRSSSRSASCIECFGALRLALLSKRHGGSLRPIHRLWIGIVRRGIGDRKPARHPRHSGEHPSARYHREGVRTQSAPRPASARSPRAQGSHLQQQHRERSGPAVRRQLPPLAPRAPAAGQPPPAAAVRNGIGSLPNYELDLLILPDLLDLVPVQRYYEYTTGSTSAEVY